MCMKLKELNLSWKKIVFKFFGRNFLAPKSGHRREIQPVLGPET